MAVMADFARLPAQRKVLVFVVIGAALGALYYQFGFHALKKNLEDAENLQQSNIAKTKSLDRDIKDFNELKPTVNRLKAQIDQNEKALPTESELPAFFETLNRKVTESGVQVNRSTQKPEEAVESFIKVPVDFEISGTFMQIKRFFASLVPHKKRPGQVDVQPTNGDPTVEEHERIVSIENLTINDPQIKNREIILTAKFTAMTFRQEDKPAVPGPPARSRSRAVDPPAPPPARHAGRRRCRARRPRRTRQGR